MEDAPEDHQDQPDGVALERIHRRESIASVIRQGIQVAGWMGFVWVSRYPISAAVPIIEQLAGEQTVLDIRLTAPLTIALTLSGTWNVIRRRQLKAARRRITDLEDGIERSDAAIKELRSRDEDSSDRVDDPRGQ